MRDTLVTVVEHPNYLKQAEKLLTSAQMKEIVDDLAAHPSSGELMKGTGGFRKMRYAGVQGKGKSGGMRVIHFFASKKGIVHLLHIYGKGEKDNLTMAERNELAKFAAILKGE